MMKKSLILFAFLTMVFTTHAQRGGFDRTEMVDREKEMVLSKVKDLSADQKLLLEGIYEEYGVTVGETIDEIRKSRDFSQFRTKMPALQKEKDLLVKDVLNAEQYVTYEEVVNSNGLGFGRGQRGEGNEQGPNQEGRPVRNRQESDTTKITQ
ncbi:MAG: hypothetical protein RIA62_06775 [Cyclobacteriaceae bacterium]